VPRLPPPVAYAVTVAFRSRRLTRWVFDRYLGIASPELATPPRVLEATGAGVPEAA
jgi:hypothetical protein